MIGKSLKDPDRNDRTVCNQINSTLKGIHQIKLLSAITTKSALDLNSTVR